MKKKIIYLIIAAFVVLTTGASSSWAEDESELSFSADAGIFSRYVWRGFALSDDSIVIQPSATISYGGFGINLWGNYDTDYFDTGADYNETDITLSYDWSFDIVSMGLGYIGYIYHDADAGDNTQELYFTVGLDTILAPTITIYRDFDTIEGWYINLGIGHSIPVTDKLSLDLAASIGYYDLDDEDYSELHDGNISASMPFAINDSFSITPSVAYSFALSDEAEDALDYNGDSDFLFGGVTCSYSF